MKIISNQPAVKWNEGFPLGNGHMGAMVLSGTKTSRIELSENTFYSGEKSSSNNQEGATKAFYEMREQADAAAKPQRNSAFITGPAKELGQRLCNRTSSKGKYNG
jgi:hypothetical protein